MSKLCVSFILLEILVSAANGFDIPINNISLRLHMKKIHMSPAAAATSGCSKEFFFTQIVDHFDTTNQKTWEQNVQINDNFFNTSVTDQPVIFLVIGGESPINDLQICYEEYPHMKLASKYNALVIQLEHRFFGKSYPIKNGTIGDMSTETLKLLLTPQQALEDLANFIKTYKYKNMAWTNPRWILFGASYPASLCAWSRAQYPNLTMGGICSSAPLWTKLDFYEYSEKMEFSISNSSATKYPNCTNILRDGFSQLKQATYTNDGRNILNSLFRITPKLDPENTIDFDLASTNFLAAVFSVFRTIVQYNLIVSFCRHKLNFQKGGNFSLMQNRLQNLSVTYNIDQLCKTFYQSQDLIRTIRNVFFTMLSEASGNQPIGAYDNNYYKTISSLNQTSYNFSDPSAIMHANERGWLWLCCGSALGWIQTTENSYGIFNRVAPLNFYLQTCTNIFGNDIDTSYITEKNSHISYVFPPPWNYTATNVLLTNGDYDPWSTLGSYTTDETRHQISKLTHGSAHCADVNPFQPGEPDGLNDTRALIEKEVNYYLSTPLPSSPTSNSFFKHCFGFSVYALLIFYFTVYLLF